MKIKPLTISRIALYITAAIFLAFCAFSIYVIFIPNSFGEYHKPLGFVIFFFTVAFGFVTVSGITFVQIRKAMIRRVKQENKYVLGHDTEFFDLNSFKTRTIRMLRNPKLKKRDQAIIAFSTATLETSFNAFQNEAITELNFETSKVVARLFDNVKGDLSHKYNCFCFNRGIFLIYTFSASQENIRTIVNSISDQIYGIVKDKNLKVWAQPFFGVKEINNNNNENLISAIEEALIARSNGEANFESFTVFVKKEKDTDSSNLLEEIKLALENNEFVPYYQPKFSLKKKEIVSCEALARWNSPTKGLLTPAVFVEKAEQYGLLSSIDIYIFEAALKDLSESIKRGRRVVPVSCNFSLYEFFSHAFIDTIMNLLEKYQIPPTLVEIEITETTSQANQFLSVSVIKKLKDLGIRVLMDDYGVGYSQIDNLKNIPFDAIKIDKSFSDLLLTDTKTQSIVKFLVELGHINDMEVIIEGVEKKEQVDILRRMGVDTIQGFYYSKALSFDDFQNFLKNNPFEGGKK